MACGLNRLDRHRYRIESIIPWETTATVSSLALTLAKGGSIFSLRNTIALAFIELSDSCALNCWCGLGRRDMDQHCPSREPKSLSLISCDRIGAIPSSREGCCAWQEMSHKAWAVVLARFRSEEKTLVNRRPSLERYSAKQPIWRAPWFVKDESVTPALY